MAPRAVALLLLALGAAVVQVVTVLYVYCTLCSDVRTGQLCSKHAPDQIISGAWQPAARPEAATKR